MVRVAKSYRTNRLVTRCLNFNQDCFLSLFLLFFFFYSARPVSIKFSVYVDFEGRISPVTYWTERGRLVRLKMIVGIIRVSIQCCGCLVKFNDIGIFLCSTSINGRNELTKVVVYGLMNFWYNALV